MKKTFAICLLLFAICSLLFAVDSDFGLALNQYAAFGNSIGENAFEYRADILPRFLLLFGETGTFFISGGLTLGYEDDFYYVPELLRTELAVRFGSFGLKAGRTIYSDPLNFIAEGLFDGLQLTHTSSAGRFGFGAWYTGLLYKKNAEITMTAGDTALFELPLDYANFAKTYFAPRRLLVSIDWEHLAIAESIGIKAAIIGQMDLNGENEKLHTQYFIFKTDIPVSDFVFELGGSLQTSQSAAQSAAQIVAAGENAFNLCFAGMFGINWAMPTDFASRLSLTARYASGENGSIGAFVPVTTKYYGHIFQPKMTALTVLGLNYSARISQKFGANANIVYFIRNDTVTPNSYSITSAGKGASDGGNLLGAEFFGQLVWSPFSDLQFNLGGGIFAPSLGNNWVNESVKWRIALSALLALF